MKNRLFGHVQHFTGAGIPPSRWSMARIRPRGMAAILFCVMLLACAGIWRAGIFKVIFDDASIIHVFKKGGPVMWPLVCASVLALGAVIERVNFLVGEQHKRAPQLIQDFFTAVRQGEMDRAIHISNSTEFYVVRALGYALAHKHKSLEHALLYAQENELKRFRRGIPLLDMVITLAPLLGLLGTVTGMMGSFSLIGGELSTPGAITGGIAEALIATAFGLGIAITALIPFNVLNFREEKARLEIESAATQLLLLLQPSADAVKNSTDSRTDFRLSKVEIRPGKQRILIKKPGQPEKKNGTYTSYFPKGQ
mgnify:CR=1 FL=1